MHRVTKLACTAISLAAATSSIAGIPQNSARSVASAVAATPPPAYAPTVRHVLAAPIVLHATIASLTRIKGPEAATVQPGFVRFYVEATVVALIRGTGALPPLIGYVVDVPLDSNGRPPKLKKAQVMLFARPVPGQPNQLQLVGRDGQDPWTPEYQALVRQIAEQVVAPDAPPVVKGLGNAFHVPGTLPGEGETQIFLITETGAPISLQILRRPGEQPRWGVALGEIVGDAAGPPKPDTLLWYRLACGLPRTLPDSSIAAESPDNAAAARKDYQLVLDALGPCGLS